MFEQAFKNIDDALWKESGCTTDQGCTEQTSWLLFLKHLDGLIDFVDRKLFPYLSGFKRRASSPDTIEVKIGEIFGEIQNKIRSGYTLRDLIGHIDVIAALDAESAEVLSGIRQQLSTGRGNA